MAAVTALGLRKLKGTALGKDRLAAGIIRVPILGSLVVGSAYGWVGEGPKGRNLELLTTIPQVSKQAGLPVLIGGDFNITPSQIRTTHILPKASLEIVAPEKRHLCYRDVERSVHYRLLSGLGRPTDRTRQPGCHD